MTEETPSPENPFDAPRTETPAVADRRVGRVHPLRIIGMLLVSLAAGAGTFVATCIGGLVLGDIGGVYSFKPSVDLLLTICCGSALIVPVVVFGAWWRSARR
ncbi:MAG: hypothetical protein KDA87_13325, partial [Planctomycetales bacterium]|nr:hypothetical protein [Planctomycetales bacterium]